jgi:hypothetical protein
MVPFATTNAMSKLLRRRFCGFKNADRDPIRSGGRWGGQYTGQNRLLSHTAKPTASPITTVTRPRGASPSGDRDPGDGKTSNQVDHGASVT